MTKLDEIEARAEKAQPGPWHAMGMGEVHAANHDDVCDQATDADAAFIAAAREDVPRLAKALRVLLAGMEVIEEQGSTSDAGLAFQYRSAALAALSGESA